MNRRWSYDRPDALEVYADGISPKMGKHCDVGRVADPITRKDLCERVDQVPADKAVLVLSPEVTPSTRSDIVPPGTYRILLRIAAANASPTTKTLELTLKGEWFSDEKQVRTDGLGVRLL